MPRLFAAILVMALVLSAPLSAQSDSTPSVSVDTAARTPAFHDGQWGARFSISDGFYGGGALLFTSPKAAWVMDVRVSGAYYNYLDTENSDNTESITLSVGRRWYGKAHSRVRPLGGTGISAGYQRYESTNSVGSSTQKSYSGGIYGELGAAIFFAPELSLGATWRATAAADHDTSQGVDTFSASVGYVSLEGAFYF